MRPLRPILWFIPWFIPLALAGFDQPPPLRLLPVDPAGSCNGSATALNINTGTASSCVNGAWTVAAPGNGVPVVSALPGQCAAGNFPQLVLLTAPVPALYACETPNVWTQVGPTVYLASNYSSLQQAVAAAGHDSEILLPAGYTAVLFSPLQLAGPGVTLRCAPNARIVEAYNGNLIQLAGRHVAIEGCQVYGGGANGGGLIVVNGAYGALIDQSTLTGAGTTANALAIYQSTDVTISANSFVHNSGAPIFAQDGLTRLAIVSNNIDSSDSSAPPGMDSIGVHTYLAGGTATDILIQGNTIVHGGGNFAIEVGSFGAQSTPPANVNVVGNTIMLARDSNGGISYSPVNGGSITGNQMDAGGHAIGIDGVELVSTTNVIVQNNTLSGTAPSVTYTIAINGGSSNTISGNTFEGGIYVGTSRPEAPVVEANVIQNNTLTAAPAAPLARGLIWLQCNTSGGSVSRNIVSGNVLLGNYTGAGVNFENDYGTAGAVVDSNQAANNQITGTTLPVAIGPHVTNTIATGNP